MRCLARLIRCGHGRLRHQERLRDLGGGQATDRAQRQRDRGGRGQRRVAAHEQQRSACRRGRSRASAGGSAHRGARPPGAAGPARCAAGRSLAATAGLDQPAARVRPGTPSAGQCAAAAISASCTASSAAAKSPKRRASTPRTCGASSRSRSSMLAPVLSSPLVGRRPSPAAPRSAAAAARRPARARREPGGDLDRARLGLDVDQLVAGEHLLGLRERPVGHHRRGHAVGGHDLGLLRPGERPGRRPARRCRRARRSRRI